jgi:hypothetical protein
MVVEEGPTGSVSLSSAVTKNVARPSVPAPSSDHVTPVIGVPVGVPYWLMRGMDVTIALGAAGAAKTPHKEYRNQR